MMFLIRDFGLRRPKKNVIFFIFALFYIRHGLYPVPEGARNSYKVNGRQKEKMRSNLVTKAGFLLLRVRFLSKRFIDDSA